MKDHNNNNRVDATDTLKNIPEDPKQAVKDDYEQTKADMKNVKDDVKERFDRDAKKEDHQDRFTL